jgi:NAD(P)-dependent dehydrogenase (short-subunit alcohol dehydrogenase family)
MTVVLITGASRGIGLELATQLHARGDTVIAACRAASSALLALGERGVRIEAGVDVTRDDSVTALAARLGDTVLDVLINNAGILEVDTLDTLRWDSVRRQFETNAIGPLRVTRALRPNLGLSSKVVIVTSRMGSIGDNTSGRMYGYRMSKAAVNMAGASLAHDLRGDQIAVGIVHPGMVATDMTGHSGVPVSESARAIIDRIDALHIGNSGTFWHANGDVLPW